MKIRECKCRKEGTTICDTTTCDDYVCRSCSRIVIKNKKDADVYIYHKVCTPSRKEVKE